jgi:hypothetical protein
LIGRVETSPPGVTCKNRSGEALARTKYDAAYRPANGAGLRSRSRA